MKGFILYVLLFFSASCYSQRAVYLEVLGNGFFYSVNIDNTVKKISPKTDLGVRFGVGGTLPFDDYWIDDDIYLAKLVVPMEVFITIGRNENKLEIGLGLGPGINKDDPFPFEYKFNVDHFLNLSYRYQKDERGLMLKAGLAFQNYHIYGIGGTIPFPKLAIGYSF